MRVASAPSAARAAARRVGTREVIRGAMPQASASAPKEAEREIIRGAMPQASASMPMKAEREFIRDKARASASALRVAVREIIRGAMPQASASTPREAEREFIRDKARASTVVGQARWGCEPWVIIRGECARASASQGCGGKVGREGALIFGVILSGSMGLPRDTGIGRGQRRRRVPVAGRSHTARCRRGLWRLMRLMGLLWFRSAKGGLSAGRMFHLSFNRADALCRWPARKHSTNVQMRQDQRH